MLPAVSINFGSVGLDGKGNGFVSYSASTLTSIPSANALADNDSGDMLFNAQPQAHPRTHPNTSDGWMVAEYQASSGAVGWGTTIAEANSFGIITHNLVMQRAARLSAGRPFP